MSKEKKVAQQTQNKMTEGPASAVPCPHCGKREDWRPVLATGTVEKGGKADCGHCGQTVIITGIFKQPRIRLAKAE